MKIFTLTLNPAYDVHAVCEDLTLYRENLAEIRSREAGGKGVNISRALHSAGVENTAVIVLGKDNAADFVGELHRFGLDSILLEKEGRIRENLTIHCQNGQETRISFSGFRIGEAVLDEVTELLGDVKDCVVTFTGRIPKGIGVESVKVFLKKLRDSGAKIVLDSKSFSVADICDVRPWLIKPNQEEISEYAGCTVETVAQAAECGKRLFGGCVENVMISMGDQGALLINGEKIYAAVPPAVDVASTIGAGDSSLAGFMAAFLRGADASLCLRTAVAFGSAACMCEGSQPPRADSVVDILKQTVIHEVV